MHFIAGKTQNEESKYEHNAMLDDVKCWGAKGFANTKARMEAESLSVFFCTGPGPDTIYGPE